LIFQPSRNAMVRRCAGVALLAVVISLPTPILGAQCTTLGSTTCTSTLSYPAGTLSAVSGIPPWIAALAIAYQWLNHGMTASDIIQQVYPNSAPPRSLTPIKQAMNDGNNTIFTSSLTPITIGRISEMLDKSSPVLLEMEGNDVLVVRSWTVVVTGSQSSPQAGDLYDPLVGERALKAQDLGNIRKVWVVQTVP
jgi:hypothetical protein